MIDPAVLSNEYLELAVRIDECEARQDAIKDSLKTVLVQEEGAEPAVWRYGPAQVQYVRGRRTEKVDTKKLRKVLVLAGVELPIIERAFAASTTESTGQPTLRISAIEAEAPVVE
jgi:hypothetical protein